jgi:very-short-patch-repair endonuclease
MRKQIFTSGPELRIAQLAKRELGILTTEELLAAGLSPAGISRRAKAGRLHRLHHGVYAVGHTALSREARLLAAVKACGEGAVLSHQSAAELWDLSPPCPGPSHVTIPIARNPGRNRQITVHRSRTLRPADATRRNRIPVTTPARTLRDLKRTLPRDQWQAALDRARSRGLDVGSVVDEEPTRSALERKFLRLCRRHRIPAPEVNERIGAFVVDFLWADRRLIAEVDGYEFHRDRQAFEVDRARDAELTRRGYRVLRFTYRQVTREPSRVARTLRDLMVARRL